MNPCLIGLSAVGLASVLTAQAPLRTGATSDDVFTRIVGVREMPDGRVLVGDAGARSMLLLSSDLKTVQPIGEKGTGRGAYSSVIALFPTARGGATLFDLDGARLLTFDAAGRLTGTDTVPPASTHGPLPIEIAQMDAQGRAYFHGERPTPQSNTGRDSVPLLRRRLTESRADTITWIRIPTAVMTPPADGGPPVFRIPTAFAWRDGFAVDEAGRVAVVRGDDYRVEWFDGTTRIASGPRVRATPVPMTDDDRRAAASSGFAVSLVPAAGQPRIIPDTVSLPAMKPFFMQNAVRIDATGDVWVERSRAANDRQTTYDIFDTKGTPRYTVVLANDAHIAGFSEMSMYAWMRAPGGKARLSRHTRPW